jgi:hypothetical protein
VLLPRKLETKRRQRDSRLEMETSCKKGGWDGPSWWTGSSKAGNSQPRRPLAVTPKDEGLDMRRRLPGLLASSAASSRSMPTAIARCFEVPVPGGMRGVRRWCCLASRSILTCRASFGFRINATEIDQRVQRDELAQAEQGDGAWAASGSSPTIRESGSSGLILRGGRRAGQWGKLRSWGAVLPGLGEGGRLCKVVRIAEVRRFAADRSAD